MKCLVCARLPLPSLGEKFALCGLHAASLIVLPDSGSVDDTIRAMRAQRFPAVEIAARTGLSVANVYKRAFRMGLTKKPRTTAAVAEPDAATVAVTGSVAAAEPSPNPLAHFDRAPLLGAPPERISQWRPPAVVAVAPAAPEPPTCSAPEPKPRRRYLRKPPTRENFVPTASPERAREKAIAYAAQLVAEGWDPDAAQQRARAAYSLEREAVVGHEPTLAPGLRARLLIASATSRSADV